MSTSEKHLPVKKEYIDNEETDLEFEEAEGLTISEHRPYDPEKIRVETHQFSLRNILDMIEDEEIDLAPDFQRYQVWNEKQKCRLIESVLLRIPLPTFYFSSDKNGLMQVVDGVQRLTTIYKYVRDKKSFPLSELEYLAEQVGGLKFHNLSTEWVRRINKTQITVNIIDPQTPQKVKFDIFKRLNTGGTPLVAQEIRHCMSKKRSRDFLKRLSTSAEFMKVMPTQIINHKRMANREMVLRAAAYKLYLPEILGKPKTMAKSYRQHESLDSFLNDVNDYLDNEITDEKMASLEQIIKNGLKNAYKLFGRHAFRKWPLGDNYTYPVNKALFETWTVLLGQYSWEEIEPNKKNVIQKFRTACKDYYSKFNDSISRGTAKSMNVAIRFKKINEIINSEA